MKTYNTRFRSVEKLKEFLLSKDIKNSSASLVQIFSARVDQNKIKNIITIVQNLLPNSTIIGSTTDGEIVNGRVLKDNIVLSFTFFEKTTIEAGLVTFKEHNYFDSANKLAKKIIKDNTKAIILFATGNFINADEVVRAFRDQIQDKDIVLAGALAADGGKFEKSFVFTTKSLTDNGLSAISLNSDDLIANVEYSFNCEAVGREFKVTKSNKNIVYEIDNIEIKKLYEKYLGGSLSKHLPLSSYLFSFLLQTKNLSIARSVIHIQKDNSFVFGGELNKNDTIQIAFTNIEKINQKLNELLDKTTQHDIESIFMFCSNSKRRFLPSVGQFEAKSFENIAPTCGFFGYGEFYIDKDQANFFNQTTSILTLSENKKRQKELNLKITKPRGVNLDYEIIKALTNIAKVSSNELEELNRELKSKIDREVKKSVKKDAILIHTSRLAQMGEMMALIAHQWRQPLSAISATSSGLAIKAELDRYDKEFFLDNLHKIEDYVAHLSTTIDDFTNFFKPTKTKELVFVKDIIKKALFILSPSIAKNSIAIKKEYNSKTKVKTYPNEVVQVVINLMKNAENILLKREILDPTIWINEYERDSNHIIEISDNGGGIDESIMDRIFDPYFSTKNSEKSTGLGLYMSKFIIEDSCGGKLLVENIDKGAKFSIIL